MKKYLAKLKEIKIKPIQVILTVLVLILIYLSYNYVPNIESNLESSENKATINFFGIELDLKNSSLLISSIVIGLLDGFNPCAMWVLIYLITLVSTLQDKRKMWLIVGTFLMASGILYFFILAGWFNLFNFIGYSKWILYGVGAFALWMGIMSIVDFIKSGGKLECDVGDMKSRMKTTSKIKEIVNSPITWGSFIAIILLAFTINSIEFVCSAGLPALFTQILALSDVSIAMKYFYMFIYTLAFMADDLIIFTLGLKAVESDIMTKYSGFSKLIGGIIMILIGIMLLFFPNLLF